MLIPMLRPRGKCLAFTGLLAGVAAYALPFRAACLVLLIPPFLLAFELRRRGDWNVWLWIWLVLVTALCAYAVWPGEPSVWVPRACACIGVSAFLGLSALLEGRMPTWEAMALSGLISVAQWLVVFPLIMLLRHLCRLASPACGC